MGGVSELWSSKASKSMIVENVMAIDGDITKAGWSFRLELEP